ncbi:unnamed protein product [Cylindrotheca closterium]|uniref:Uncharacterized protein n=1 Tax=Cylindrotheca closterium TaxID=2856 RepID=A0AAD2CTG4_9STRA|nr:unnamed protein product [Cylindrotheca closterium]
MSDQLSDFIKRAEEEELDGEFSAEAAAALAKALPIVSPQFPSLAECLMSAELYDEAEKYYYDEGDEFPIKYSGALKSIAITMHDETEFDPSEVEEISTEPPRGSIEVILGDTPRQKAIERELDFFCKRAARDNLDGIEMRSEAIKALKIGANRLCYKKKFYDAENDKFIVFPTVTGALLDQEIYNIAQKKYYGPRDEFPLRYTSALRSLAVEAGGAEEDHDEIEDMAADCESTDGYFDTKPMPDMFHTARLEFMGTPDALYEKEPEVQKQEDPENPGRGSTAKILGDSPRQKCIERELNFFIKKAADEHLDEAMRDEAIKALKIATAKFAYKRKMYDPAADVMRIFPSVANCLIDGDVYEEAEKHYYDKGDDYPLKYIGALRTLGVELGGAEEEVDEWDQVAMDCESVDGFFDKKPLPQASEFEFSEHNMMEVEEETEVTRGSTAKVLGDSPRQVCIERDVNFFIKKAQDDHIPDGMRDEAIRAIKIACNQIAFKKKYYDVENDKFVIFPSVAACLIDQATYDAASKKYYGLMDQIPLQYVSVLRSLGVEVGGAEEDYEKLEDMAADCESTDGFFDNKPLPDLYRTARLEFMGMPDGLEYAEEPEPEPEPAETRGTTEQFLGDSPRQKCIERELDFIIKLAAEDHLDDPMRDEAIKALKIATNKFAYKRKMYDAAADVIRVFPSVANCLIDGDVFEEAEKLYYDDGDDYPLKYISALRSIGIELGGAEEEVEEWDPVAMDCESVDGFFDKKPLPQESEFEWDLDEEEVEEEEDNGRGSTAKILGDTPRQKLIEAEVDAFVAKSHGEHLEDEMRNEAIKGLKHGANKYAYKKKFYDAEKDVFVVFPSVAWCMIDNDIYEVAEEHYYQKEDEFPLKYTSAMRSIGIEAGGADEDVEHMMEMAMDCESSDGFFATKLEAFVVPEEVAKKKKKSKKKKKVVVKKKGKKTGDTKKKSKKTGDDAKKSKKTGDGDKKSKKSGDGDKKSKKAKDDEKKKKSSRSKSPKPKSSKPKKRPSTDA